MAVDRRTLIKRGLLGGALLAVGGGAFLAFRRTRLATLPPEGLRILDEVEYSVLHAIAARMIPPRDGFAGLDKVRVAYNADRILERADRGARKELKQLIRLFENGAANFLFGGRPHPFTQLPEAEQDEVLAEWRGSRITVRRTGYNALRAVVMASYYSSPMAWPAVGYPGPPEGFHQPDAPEWRGPPQPREGFGVWHDEEPKP